MADPPINMSVTGITGGHADNIQVIGINQVTGPDPLHDILVRTKDEVADMTAGMIRVSAVDVVVNKLSSGQHWVTITGNAGDGKTTLGYLVLKEFLQKGVVVYTLYKPEEYDQIEKMKEDKVIMFDDRFGAFLADHQLIKNWLDVILKISRVIEKGDPKTKVIFISRRNVVNESKVYLGHLTDTIFDRERVVDLSKGQLTDERRKIMDYHLGLENVNIHPEIKTIVCNMEVAHGFPHCCKMFSKLRSKGYNVPIEEFFESPLKFLDKTTKVLYNDNCKHLFQLMIKNDGMLDIYDIKDEDERHDLFKVEKEQEGSYITVWRNGICQFAHPSVYESVLNVINDLDPLYCVRYATLSVIRQKMIISTSEEEDRSRYPCYILVKPVPAVLTALAERFKEELLKEDYSVFKHRLCRSREFCEALVSCCVTTDETGSMANILQILSTHKFCEALLCCGVYTNDMETHSKQHINRSGKDKETMLWTALRGGRMVAVQTLVKAEADVDMRDKKGRTPLHYLYQLMNQNAAAPAATHNDDRDYFDYSLNMDTVRVIINDGGGDINVKDRYGMTPLHYLFKCDKFTTEDVHWITTKGKGDLNKCEQHKSTPLHYLCANLDLQLDTVDVLIKEGKGDFNKGDEHGTTPFHYLCDNGKVERDVVLQVVNTAKGDINKQDENGITPLHVLCKGSLPMEDILTLINQGDKADRYGNSPLHYLCRRRGINAEVLQHQLEHLNETDRKKQNNLGYTPSDYLTDQDNSLPWTDGMIARSAADLVLCKLKHGEDWTYVLGRAMILNSERVHRKLQVEDFGRVLTNLEESGDRESPGQFSRFEGTCSSPVPVPPSPSPLTTPPSYWETSSTLTRRERSYILLQMGLKLGRRNMDEGLFVSGLPDSVCVSVWDDCHSHRDRLCIQVWRRDQEDSEEHQVGECVSLSLPTPGVEFTLTFGLVLDVGRGRVGFIDVERGQLLCKVDLQMKEEVSPMFYVDPFNDLYATRMRLVSGREICVTDRKIHLIQQALSD